MKEREERHLKYTSGRDRAKKKEQGMGFSATYLKMPQGASFFRPKVGIYLLDILPYRVGKHNPFAQPGSLHYERTYHLHGRIGADQNAYLCPRMTAKKPCPICEHRQRLMREDAAENEALIKDISPKERQLFNVRNLKEPDKGIQLFDISYHLFGRLLDARIRDSDEEDEWDLFYKLEGGLTLKVGFAEKSFGGRSFVEAETIDFKTRKEDYDEEFLDQVFNLDELLKMEEYDTLKERFLESAEEDDSDEDDEPKAKKKKAKDEDEDDSDEDEPKAKKKKAKADDDDDDDDEEDEPKAKKKRVEDEDDSDDDDSDDEDEPKAKKKKSKDEDEDWDDFDEEDKPKGKKKAAEDDDDDEEEDEPKAKKKRVDEDEDDSDEDEPKAKKKKVKAEVNGDDEDEDE